MRLKFGDQSFGRTRFQLGVACRVGRCGEKLVILQDRAQVKPSATAQDRDMPMRTDLPDSGDAVALELVDVVLAPRIDDVDQM